MSWAMNGQSRFLAGPTYLHQPFLQICSPCCISASSLGISHGRRKEDACLTHETAGVWLSLGDRAHRISRNCSPGPALQWANTPVLTSDLADFTAITVCVTFNQFNSELDYKPATQSEPGTAVNYFLPIRHIS